ncbi:hypothetical protein UlMin_045908 [Ulmus minor]
MSCIVWNVRGLGNQRAFKNLNRLLSDEDPSLVFLCETKLVAGQCKNLKQKLGYDGCFVRDCIGRKGGLILLWKESVEVVIQSTSAGHIDALVSQAERHWRFTGFYGSPEVEGRKFSWDLMSKLASIAELSHLPWLVGGDFNEILLDSEKRGGRPRALAQMMNFQSCLDLCGLKDLSFSGEQFTWVKRQGLGDCIQERLDRFVGTFDWGTLFPNAKVTNLAFFHSDHRAVKISLGSSWVWVRKQAGSKRQRRFHFEEIWASDLECRELITSNWAIDKAKAGVEDVTVRLKNCAVETDRWGFNKYGSLKKSILETQTDLEAKKADNSFRDHITDIRLLERRLEFLNNKEEIYWRQRSRIEWLAHGDRNSKYFHHKAAERSRKNRITGLFSNAGEWNTDPGKILGIISDYFQDIFLSSSPSTSDFASVLSCVHPKVTTDMNNQLLRPFTSEDIKKALMDMNPTKAPGPDGLPAIFFQKFWDIIGEDITKAALHILNDGGDMGSWNATLITLIPKIQHPTTVKNFRPISLCTVLYKIVSRSITNRFRLILDDVIGDPQSAFVPGRLITDNVILGFEVMHWIRKHTGGQTGYAALKLDMSKAYDRVEWSFLRALIMRCISSVSYSFLINGEVKGFLQPSRGLRQGDPLSPYLFVICAHGLSELLLSSEQRKLFKGVKIAASCPPISHLFFADDSLIFCRARSMDCVNLRRCLDYYSKASGQLVNFEKSALSFSPNTSAYVREEICSLFGISQVAGHDMYLGLPTFSMRNKRIQFGYIRDRVVKKLQGWKEKIFSHGGKEVLLKAVVQAIPTYAMSCFMIPDSILKEIEAACAHFWWGSSPDHKRVHWKKWSDLCQPKAAGGMGFKDLSLFNQALLGKQVWRITQKPHSLVAQVLKARYFPCSSIWEAEALSSASYVWKSILWGRNLVAHGMRWRVGNGSQISVYNSRWIPQPWNFQVCSPRTLPNNSLVADLLDENGRWNAPLVSQMFLDFEAKLILALPRPALGCSMADKQDSYCWHYDAKGLYSVKSAYRLGMELACSVHPSSTAPATGSWWKALWNASIPPKVKVFWWRAINDILPTSWNLRSHHIPTAASCALCGYGMETTSHSLFLCPLMKPFWKSTLWASCLEVVKKTCLWDAALWVKEVWDERAFEIFLLSVWESWNLRNLLVHGRSKQVIGMELCNMDVLLDEFHAAR